MKKSVFLKKVKNRVIENVQETEKNRLSSFLTRSNFCKFRVREFFNSHRISQHLSRPNMVLLGYLYPLYVDQYRFDG